MKESEEKEGGRTELIDRSCYELSKKRKIYEGRIKKKTRG